MGVSKYCGTFSVMALFSIPSCQTPNEKRVSASGDFRARRLLRARKRTSLRVSASDGPSQEAVVLLSLCGAGEAISPHMDLER